MRKTTMKKDAAPKMAAADMKKNNASCQTCMCGSCGCEHGDWGMTILRVVVGALFLLHGIQKFTGLGGVQGFFASLGLPGWVGVLVALAETVGGAALILGIWSRWSSYVLTGVMLGAFAFANFGWGGWGWIFVVGGLVGLCGLDRANTRGWSCWLTFVVLAVIVGTALWMQISGGINPKANLERDLALLAGLVAIAWNGPGVWSFHSKCSCCDH